MSHPTGPGTESRPDPLRAKRQDAVLALARAAERLEAQFRRAVEPSGITLQQYKVLRIARDAGEGGLPTLLIADRMIDHAPGVTRLVDRLEQRELIRRVRGKDRRQVLCRVTAKGVDLVASLDRAMGASLERALASLTHNEIGALTHLLGRIRAQPESPAQIS